MPFTLTRHAIFRGMERLQMNESEILKDCQEGLKKKVKRSYQNHQRFFVYGLRAKYVINKQLVIITVVPYPPLHNNPANYHGVTE